MQQCSICDKAIYGHPSVDANKLVCGSCTLSKSKDGVEGKGMFTVRQELAKLKTVESSRKVVKMKEVVKVKSNALRNRSILLDGRHTVLFDGEGIAKMPAHLMELLEREMIMRPNRYTIIEESVPVAEVSAPVVVEEPVPEKVEVEEPVEELAKEEPKKAKLSKKKD